MPLIGIEGPEGCSQWNFMPRSDMRQAIAIVPGRFRGVGFRVLYQDS